MRSATAGRIRDAARAGAAVASRAQMSVPTTTPEMATTGTRNDSPAPNASVNVIDHAVMSARTVPITSPSIATKAYSITNAARTDWA